MSQSACSGLSLVAKTSIAPSPPPPTNLVNQTVAFGDTAVFSFLPPGVEPLVRVGDRVRGGLTIMARALPKEQAGRLAGMSA